MNHLLLYHLFQYAFFLLAPVLLLIKWNKPQVSWWLIIAMAIFAGWALIFSSAYCYFYYPDAVLKFYELIGITIPSNLPVARGPEVAMVTVMGWLYALIYLLPWLIVYKLLAYFRQKSKIQ